MKVSDNPSAKSVRWRWHGFRLAGMFLLLSAIWSPDDATQLVGAGMFLFVMAYVSKAHDEDFLVEVFDEGDCLLLKREEIRAMVALTEIEQLTMEDGGDGKDFVVIMLLHPTPFGRQIDLFPLPLHKFDWDVKRWVYDLNARISDAKSSAAVTTAEPPAATSLECAAIEGQVWL